MDNIRFHPASSLGISLDDSSDIAVKVQPASDISLNVPSDVRGGDIVVDGEFNAACGVNWVCGAGWNITGGKAVGTAATTNLRQMGILTIGVSYEIIYTISDYSGGTVSVQAGTTGGTSRSADGTYTETLLCAGDTNLKLNGGAAFTAKIDSIKAYQV